MHPQSKPLAQQSQNPRNPSEQKTTLLLDSRFPLTQQPRFQQSVNPRKISTHLSLGTTHLLELLRRTTQRQNHRHLQIVVQNPRSLRIGFVTQHGNLTKKKYTSQLKIYQNQRIVSPYQESQGIQLHGLHYRSSKFSRHGRWSLT